jgi:hypothetical protein
MTPTEFNEKYKDFLEEGYYGLSISNDQLTEWLDSKFQEFIQLPNFSYLQIKSKFGMGVFYCQGLTTEQIREVEKKITSFLKN